MCEDGQFWKRVLVAIILAAACLFFCVEWVRDIYFYWEHDWNFDLPHPGFEIRWCARHGHCGKKLGNFERIVSGWPFMIAVPAILIGALFVRSRK